MTTWSAADAKRRFSQLIHDASKAPQIVKVRGIPVGVVVSYERFTQSKALSGEKSVADWLEELAALNEEEGDPDIPTRTDRGNPIDGDSE